MGLVRGIWRFVAVIGTTYGIYLPLWFDVFERAGGDEAWHRGLAVNTVLFLSLTALSERLAAPFARARARSKAAAFFDEVFEPLRIGVLYVSMVTTPVATYFLLSFGGFELWELVAGRFGVGWALVAVIAAYLAAGWGVQLLFGRVVLRFMSRRSRAKRRVGRQSGGGSRQRGPRASIRRRRVDTAEAVDVPASNRLLFETRAFRRFRTLEFLAAPVAMLLAALLGVLAIDLIDWPVETSTSRADVATRLVSVWALVLLAVGIVSGTNVLRRTPLRQLHLVFEIFFSWLGIAGAGVMALQGLGAFMSRESIWKLGSDLSGGFRLVTTSRHTLWGVTVFAAFIAFNDELGAGENHDAFAHWAAITIVFSLGAYALVQIGVQQRFDRRGASVVRVDLIYLRVFGCVRRSRFIVDEVGARWEGNGSVLCIAAPDVATDAVDPADLADILYGRVEARFVGDHASQNRQIGQLRQKHGVRQVFCHDDTWKPTLDGLLEIDDTLVLMDLRGFSEENQGCVYEITRLVHRMPLRRLVFLTDDTTDVDLFDETLETAWSQLPAESPNRTASPGQVTVCRLVKANSRHAHRLTQHLLILGDRLL